MGLVPCPLPCHTNTKYSHHDDQSQSTSSHLHSESSTSSSSSSSSSATSSSSLSSLPSLPSVPSLNPSSISNQLLQDVLEGRPATHHNILATLKPHPSSYVSSLVLTENFLFSGSSNGDITAWSRSNPSTHNKVVATTNSTVKSLVVSGDHRNLILFSAHQDHKIRVWKIDVDIIAPSDPLRFKRDGQKQPPPPLPNGKIFFKCIATLPTLKDRLPRFFSPKDYVQIRRHKKCTWVHHVDAVSALAVSDDMSLLYSASWDRTFKIWRPAPDFKCVESVSNAHDDAINAIVVSRDGFVYTGSADKKIKAWRKLVGEKKHALVGTWQRHKSAVNALAFSSDGCVLYSGACDRSVLVWERDGGGGGGGDLVLVGALRGHSKAILCLAVVGDLVCSGSADYSVRVWRRLLSSAAPGLRYCCLAVLEGHRRPVKCLTAAVDDSDCGGDSFVVYSGSLDCDINVWKIRVL